MAAHLPFSSWQGAGLNRAKQVLAGGREAECPSGPRGCLLFTGLPGSQGLLNGIDYWLAPLSQPVTSDCAVSADPASRSVCLPPWDQGASAWPCLPPPPTVLCSGAGLHAHHLPVMGGSVGSERRSSRLSPAPTKLTEAWRGHGLALGHTRVLTQQDMPPIVLPHYCLTSLLSWDTSSLPCPWLAPSTGPGALTDAGEEKAES